TGARPIRVSANRPRLTPPSFAFLQLGDPMRPLWPPRQEGARGFAAAIAPTPSGLAGACGDASARAKQKARRISARQGGFAVFSSGHAACAQGERSLAGPLGAHMRLIFAFAAALLGGLVCLGAAPACARSLSSQWQPPPGDALEHAAAGFA